MKKKLLLICLCIFFLCSLFIQPASATNDPVEIVSVNRTIHISYNKYFRVTDEYTFINTGSDPLSSIIIAAPYEFTSNLASISILGSNSEELAFNWLPYDGSGLIKWRVYLDAPLFGGDTVLVNTTMTFIKLFSDHSGDIDGVGGHVDFNFVKYVSSPYNIQNCSVTFTCDSKVTVYNPVSTSYLSTSNLVSDVYVPKNNITSYSGRFNLTEPALSYQYTLSAVKFPYIQREIELDLWGYLYISEELMIENYGPLGGFRITTYSFEVSPGAENIQVFDKFGSLDFGVSEDYSPTISINFDATRYTLLRGETTIFWVTYRVPLSTYIQRSGDRIQLDLDILFGGFDCLVENFDVTLILPKDASLNYVLPSVDSVTTLDNSLVLTFNETDVTYYNTKVIELEFDVSKSYFHFLARPLLFLLILGAVCSGYVIFKRVLPSKEKLFERGTVVPTPILLEFCSLFEEKVSIVTELEQLDEDLKRRKIKKRIYRNQRKTEERKILELDKDIDELKVTLKNAGGRFAQIVNELEINEAERQSAKDGLFNLEQRYLRKKISIVAYRKLSSDLENRHKKTRTRIDKLLFELREILS